MNEVHAVIELKITPQRDTGFGKIAEKVARYDQVEACFLMSGTYDLLVFVKGDSLQDVAQFVAQDLSTLDGVLSTATHFMLKTYKAKGVLDFQGPDDRLAVTHQCHVLKDHRSLVVVLGASDLERLGTLEVLQEALLFFELALVAVL